MKCRLKLKLTNSTWECNHVEILCKKIHSITIDGKTYYKNNYGNDSLKIQNFYRMILKNIPQITYIKYGNFVEDDFKECTEIYLKDEKLHNYAGPARIYTGQPRNIAEFYIEGEKMLQTEWKTNTKRNIWLRKNKLERLINEQN